ncbi:hypothetical protein DERF_001453 [Dermatophagoides farinae]|uniref:Uncharacterized protein n=1 Tax=Dermatophagoides farinae TaxID=6954 RepID=A0A922LB69_DERFA|nr:hypothetical protein DERF_001453 [Dermatophagoides farinae]
MPGNHQIEGNKYIHNDDYHYQPDKPCNRWDLLVTLNEYDELWIILINITNQGQISSCVGGDGGGGGRN